MRIVIPGGAGFVGQNLLTLKEMKKHNVTVIDRNKINLELLKKLHPHVKTINADISELGTWTDALKGADTVIQLNAQIASKHSEAFYKSNVAATRNITKTCKRYKVPYLIHVSSSVVESVANDDYTKSKKAGENLVKRSRLKYLILRPTLMYGCFDYKNLGWISRFLEASPIYPVPGHGRYVRQPLYVLDFCRILASALKKQPKNKIYDITGKERINYIDLVKIIAKKKKLKRLFLNVPIPIFGKAMDFYSLFTRRPVFTSDQMRALIDADVFKVVPWDRYFGVKYTKYEKAWGEILRSPYQKYVLKKAS
jgi:nucleoside-diphosphate-sugar epimerase